MSDKQPIILGGNIPTSAWEEGVEEAPMDGHPYVRQNASWLRVIVDVPEVAPGEDNASLLQRIIALENRIKQLG